MWRQVAGQVAAGDGSQSKYIDFSNSRVKPLGYVVAQSWGFAGKRFHQVNTIDNPLSFASSYF